MEKWWKRHGIDMELGPGTVDETAESSRYETNSDVGATQVSTVCRSSACDYLLRSETDR